jgi:rod shape determining protein RodA
MEEQNQNIVLAKQTFNTFDIKLFICTLLLLGIGLLSLYSAVHSSEMITVFSKQLVSAGIGIILMVGLFFAPKEWIRMMLVPSYLISIFLLLLVLTPLGTEINGTKGWLRLGFLSLQPAELAKPAVIFFAAWRLSNKYTDVNQSNNFFILLLSFLVPSALILLQPDFGSFSVILVLFCGVLYWAGFNGFILYCIACLPIIGVSGLINKTLLYVMTGLFSTLAFFFKRKLLYTVIAIALFVAVGFGAPLIVNKLQDYQQARIETLLNPESDPLGTGYNVLQSILAIGSGELTGKGYLQGTQTQLRYIPMQWTDFIFSVPNEEFGFIGGASIILLFTFLLWRGVKIAFNAQDRTSSIIAAGIVFTILYHCVINMGMTMGIMPVTGIPLPFISYGGSSLIMNLGLVGILLNINKNTLINQSTFNPKVVV